jgi:hypothetical protein
LNSLSTTRSCRLQTPARCWSSVGGISLS